MTPLNENFGNELKRMTQLAGLEQRPGFTRISESAKQTENQGENPTIENAKKVQENVEKSAGKEITVSENKDSLLENDDLFGDFNDIFTQQFNDLQGRVVGKLSKDLKTAMVLNNVKQNVAVELDLHTAYDPHTAGAKADPDSAENRQTIFDKKPIEKIKGGEDEFERLKGITKEPDGSKVITKPQTSVPVTFVDSEIEGKLDADTRKSLAKWHPLPKDESIISYHRTRDQHGYETFTLSDKGKEQLEYLQRMLSGRPLHKPNDPNIAVEMVLANPSFIYKDVVIVNSEKIIRDFFTKAVTPIVASVLKRTKAVPKDAQFDRFVTVAVDHAIDATKAKKYDSKNYTNFGAWFMQVVKNKVIDQLKGITTFQVDSAYVYDMLSNMSGPLNVDSQLNPKEAQGNYTRVINSDKTFTKNGEEKNYYTYIYDNPEDAIADLDAAAVKTDEGYLKSPLRSAYLREPGLFYKSFIRGNSFAATNNQNIEPYYDQEDVKTNLARTTDDTLSMSPEYFENYEDIPAAQVIQIANQEVTNILTEIARQIVVTSASVGETVKLSGRENAKYPTLTKGKSYTVNEKGKDETPSGGGIGKNYYKVIDDTGAELKVSARALTPTSSAGGAGDSIASKVQQNEAAVVEILRLLLQYGRMKPVYTKTVYFPKNGEWITKNKGETALTDRTGRLTMPYAAKKENARYGDIESAPIEYVWSAEKRSAEVSDQLIDDVARVAQEKGLTLPSQFFTVDNKPRYREPNAPENTKEKTVEFINSIRNALRKYFGFTTLQDPIIQKNRNVLKKLVDNYKLAINRQKNRLDEAENPLVRQYIRNYIAEKLK